MTEGKLPLLGRRQLPSSGRVVQLGPLKSTMGKTDKKFSERDRLGAGEVISMKQFQWKS